jgi:hypothetical protein
MGGDGSTAMRIDFVLPNLIDLASVRLEDALQFPYVVECRTGRVIYTVWVIIG